MPKHISLADASAQLVKTLRPIAALLRVRNTHLLEAVAAGFGFNTHAALQVAQEAAMPTPRFDRKPFQDRLTELKNRTTAVALIPVLDGAIVQVEIETVGRSFDTSGTLKREVRVDVATPRGVNEQRVWFDLPTKQVPGRGETYRLDSAHFCRGGPKVIRRSADGRLLTSKLDSNGSWHGGLFLYDKQHIADDREAVGWVEAQLASVILRSMLPFEVEVTKGQNYDPGFFDVCIRLSHDIADKLSFGPENHEKISDFLFDFPMIEHHRVDAKSNYRAAREEQIVGRFNDGIWRGMVHWTAGNQNQKRAPATEAVVFAAFNDAISTALKSAELI